MNPGNYDTIESHLPHDGLRDYCRFAYETATQALQDVQAAKAATKAKSNMIAMAR